MSDLQTPRPMDERRKTYLRLIAEICIAIVSVAAVALLGGPVVGILLPFILAFIMAWMFNPVIAWLQRHLRLTRKLFSYILVLVFYALLFGLCLFFAGQLVSQAIDLARSVPTFIADLQGLYNELVTWLQEVLAKLPAEYAGVGDEIFSLLNSAWEWLKTLLSGALSYVMGISRNVALEVPSFVIFLTVLVLASCIITADFPNLRENIYSYLGVRGKNSSDLDCRTRNAEDRQQADFRPAGYGHHPCRLFHHRRALSPAHRAASRVSGFHSLLRRGHGARAVGTDLHGDRSV